MPVFDWEVAFENIARHWPRSGPLYQVMYTASDFSQTKWLILAILGFLLIRRGWRSLWIPITLGVVAVAAGDLISRRVVKALVMRPRPDYLNSICDLSACWGFVSSHATNVAAACTFLCLYDRRNLYWSVPTVLLVDFSRLYLADHFPLDVMGGTALGVSIGFGLFKIYESKFKRRIRSFADAIK